MVLSLHVLGEKPRMSWETSEGCTLSLAVKQNQHEQCVLLQELLTLFALGGCTYGRGGCSDSPSTFKNVNIYTADIFTWWNKLNILLSAEKSYFKNLFTKRKWVESQTCIFANVSKPFIHHLYGCSKFGPEGCGTLSYRGII